MNLLDKLMGKPYEGNKFCPSEEHILYKYSKNECYKVLTGECLLELIDYKKVDGHYFETVEGGRSRNDKMYCPVLSKLISLNQEKYFKDINVRKRKDGKYDFYGGDGRHRTCIFSKLRKGSVIKATISQEKK